MKRRRIISAIAIMIAIGMGATAYAASTGNSQSPTQGQRLGLGRITSMRGYDYVLNVLKKLGLSDSDITNAAKAGKTPYDLVVEKGMTQERFKDSLFEEKSKSIDAAVEKGSISKEEGENLKANLKANMDNCTGNFGQRQGFGWGNGGRGQGCGMFGQGQAGSK